jgi:hypothetical protein
MELSAFRLRIGEGFRGKVFFRRGWVLKSPDWTHGHCQMCNAYLCEHPQEGDYSEGYVTFTPQSKPKGEPVVGEGWIFVPGPQEPEGSPLWMCLSCFDQYHGRFDWRTDSTMTA